MIRRGRSALAGFDRDAALAAFMTLVDSDLRQLA